MKRLFIPLIAVLLVACGGGDYEEPDKTTEPVNCQAQPELCR